MDLETYRTMIARGRFITFEGGEGSGKSTQIRLLGEWLAARTPDTCLTREPGGTEGAELVRNLVLEGPRERWHPLGELLLMMAARTDHIDKLIRPQLANGSWVLSDRFHDSSRVYQGLAGGVGLEVVDRLHEPVLGDLAPDLTVLLDIDVETGLRRRRGAGQAGRFEEKGLAYHEQVRAGFLRIAALDPERFVVVSAAADQATVSDTIRSIVAERFALPDDG